MLYSRHRALSLHSIVKFFLNNNNNNKLKWYSYFFSFFSYGCKYFAKIIFLTPFLSRAKCSSVVERPLMEIGSIPHGGLIELFLVPACAP